MKDERIPSRHTSLDTDGRAICCYWPNLGKENQKKQPMGDCLVIEKKKALWICMYREVFYIFPNRKAVVFNIVFSFSEYFKLRWRHGRKIKGHGRKLKMKCIIKRRYTNYGLCNNRCRVVYRRRKANDAVRTVFIDGAASNEYYERQFWKEEEWTIGNLK